MSVKRLVLRYGQFTGLIPLEYRSPRRDYNRLRSIRSIIVRLLTKPPIRVVPLSQQTGGTARNHLNRSPLLIAFVALLLTAHAALTVATTVIESNNELPRLDAVVDRYLGFVLGAVSLVVPATRAKTFVQLYRTLARFRCEESERTRKLKSSVVRTICGVTVAFCILYASDLCDTALELDTYTAYDPYQRLLTNAFAFQTVALYVAFLAIARDAFVVINNEIARFTLPEGVDRSAWNRGAKVGNFKAEAVLILARRHDTAADACDRLNAIYGVQMLCYTTTTFLVVLFAVFRNYKLLLRPDPGESIAFGRALWFNSRRAIAYAALAVHALTATTETVREASETGKLIHKVLNERPYRRNRRRNWVDAPGTTDSGFVQTVDASGLLKIASSSGFEVENEENSVVIWNYFSLQLFHRKIVFNACHMFDLDYGLLYSLVAACTTYMVILIQFDLAKFAPKVDNNRTIQWENDTNF